MATVASLSTYSTHHLLLRIINTNEKITMHIMPWILLDHS